MINNLFICLSKFCSSEENFLTESFVYTIQVILEKEGILGRDILDKICTDNKDFSFKDDEAIEIKTQQTIKKANLIFKSQLTLNLYL